MPDRIIVDLPRHAGAAFASALFTRLVESSTSAWEEGFGRLEQFAVTEGHAHPEHAVVVDGYKLGQWVSNQRAQREVMDRRRRELLEALPKWTWNGRDAIWEVGYKHLVSYAEEFGVASPAAQLTYRGFRLGIWVSNQRVRRETLDPERVLRLERLPGWAWNPHEAAWDEGFKHLEAFVAEHGHARPSQDCVFNGYRLGGWVDYQRTNYKSLAPERIGQLETLPGWIWNARHAKWEKGFDHLKAFVAEHGHAQPTTQVVTHGFRLGSWVHNQRVRRETLDPERVLRLERLPGWAWNPHEAAWDEGFKHLEAFVAEHGHARPRLGVIFDGYPLGSWVSNQRHRRQQLDAERKRRLEELPGWAWNAHEAAWDEGFKHLEAFVAEHGHARPSHGLILNEFRLGQWVSVQRTQRATMKSSRRDLLEALPGWAWDINGAKWEEDFERLLAFVSQSGHARPPRDLSIHGFRLGEWVHNQRRSIEKREPSQRKRLEALPGWTWSPRSPKD